MLFHDINPQLMYVRQQDQKPFTGESVALTVNQKHLRFNVSRLRNLFQTKPVQSVCCACC